MAQSPNDSAVDDCAVTRRTLLVGLGAAPFYPLAEAQAATGNAPEAVPAPAPSAVTAPMPKEAVTDHYLDAIQALQGAHTRMMNLLADAFERRGLLDLSATDAMVLMHVGTGEKTVGQISQHVWLSNRKTLSRAVNRLIKSGFLEVTNKARPQQVALTQKGRERRDMAMEDAARQASGVAIIGGVDATQLADAQKTLKRLDRFWTDTIAYRL